jgi:hypothetical protein
MQIFFLTIGLFCQIFIPGWAIARSVRQDCSVSDSFATGLLACICVTLTSSLLFSSVETISLASRLMLATITVLAIARLLREPDGLSNEWQSIKWAVAKFPWMLSFLTLSGTAVFVLSHSLGFDDVAHLTYLGAIKGEVLFPVLIEVREGWSVARYPLFGITNAVLTQGLSAGGFLGYYLVGIAVLIFFLAKIFEFVLKKSDRKPTAIAVYFLTLGVLVAASFDNYLNYGLYPLQQAKLLFFFGIVFLISFFHDQDNSFSLFLSGGFLTTSLAYHFNLLLLAPVVVLIGIVVIILEKRRSRNLATIGLIFIVSLFIGILALRSETGFIRYQEPLKIEMSDEVEVVKPPEPTIIELIWRRAKSAFMWVSDGHYRDFYIARVYSLELLLIPTLLLIGPYLGMAYLFRLTAFSAFLIALGAQAGVRLPLQIMSTLLQSGPWAIAVDFWRSGIEISRSDEAVYLTEAYTALVLNGLGYSNVIGLDSKIANQIFSPLLKQPGPDVINAIRGWTGAEEAHFLLNSRYWGVGSLEKYELLGAVPKIEIDKDLNAFIANGQKRRSETIFHTLAAITKMQADMPLSEVPAGRAEVIWGTFHDQPYIQDSGVFLYRDSALVSLQDPKEGEMVRLQITGVGDFLEIMIREDDDPYFLSLISVSGDQEKGELFDSQIASIFVDHAQKDVKIKPKKFARKIELFISLDTGHLAGLGEIREIKVQ